jgi:hypothetical protein
LEPRFRAAYNAAYAPERFERYARTLRERLGCEAGFRLAETPVFLPPELVERCERAASEIVAQLAEPARLARMRSAVPARFDADGRGNMPQFAVVDFGIERAPSGGLAPRVVELQGFPSLLAFENVQRDAWVGELEAIMPGTQWSCWHGGLDGASFLALARRAIVGNEDPAEVVLVDRDPNLQKTYCDFAATRLLFGIDACDPRALYLRRGRLYRRDADGREHNVARIYNRIVGDEFERPDFSLAFDLRESNVTWAPHPAWFWHWSKASMPHLEHPSVPQTRLLSELDAAAERLDLRDYVLKPLFSYAGAGVNVRPTAADVAAIAGADRDRWCLQEKITYAAAFTAPDGEPVKVELRILLVRPDDAPTLVPAINLCRLSRGEMSGVDYNRDRSWVGSSIGLWETTGAVLASG